MLIIINSQYSA